MSIQEKVYVAYDADNDHDFYEQITDWVKSDNTSFNFINGYEYSKLLDKVNDDILKAQILARMDESSVCVLLIGKKTKSFRRFVRWQIEYAINSGKPIIAVNINGIRSVDYERCPTILKKNLSIHIASQAPILEYALLNWPASHEKYHAAEKNATYRYSNDIYDELNLETYDV